MALTLCARAFLQQNSSTCFCPYVRTLDTGGHTPACDRVRVRRPIKSFQTVVLFTRAVWRLIRMWMRLCQCNIHLAFPTGSTLIQCPKVRPTRARGPPALSEPFHFSALRSRSLGAANKVEGLAHCMLTFLPPLCLLDPSVPTRSIRRRRIRFDAASANVSSPIHPTHYTSRSVEAESIFGRCEREWCAGLLT